MNAADGPPFTVHADTVVLASGGFQGSPQLLGRYLGASLSDLRVISPGGGHDKGEGLEMAIACGADVAGEFEGYHCEPVDARSEKSQAINMLFPYGLLVNSLGERFVDEGAKTVDESYECHHPAHRRAIRPPGVPDHRRERVSRSTGGAGRC